jgi:hypothetical protein
MVYFISDLFLKQPSPERRIKADRGLKQIKDTVSD